MLALSAVVAPEVCPALRAGAPLDPKALVLSLKKRLHHPNDKELVGDIVSKEALWSCTTCGACMQACPARMDLPSTIVDMRRHLALEMGEFPAGLAKATTKYSKCRNPWGMDPASAFGLGKRVGCSNCN